MNRSRAPRDCVKIARGERDRGRRRAPFTVPAACATERRESPLAAHWPYAVLAAWY
jgi:hypothetical protein